MVRAVHLRPFLELRLLRAYSIQPQCLGLSPALEKLKDSEAARKTSPGIYTLLLKQAALLELIFGVMAKVKSLTGASLP